jgi:hypothetical protein
MWKQWQNAAVILIAVMGTVLYLGCQGFDSSVETNASVPDRLLYTSDGIRVYEKPGHPGVKVVQYIKFAVNDAQGRRHVLSYKQASASLGDDSIVTPIIISREVVAARVQGNESFLKNWPPDELYEEPEQTVTPPTCDACPCCTFGGGSCHCTWSCWKSCY